MENPPQIVKRLKFFNNFVLFTSLTDSQWLNLARITNHVNLYY